MRHPIGKESLVALAMVFLIACGGGDKKKDVAVVPTPAITPGTAEITLGQQQLFAVTPASLDFTVSALAGAGCVKNGNNIVCTPTVAGSYDIAVAAAADGAKTAKATLKVNEVTIAITPNPLPPAVLNHPFAFEVNTDFTLSVKPEEGAGCTKTNATTVTCLPTAVGEYEVTVTAVADASKTFNASFKVDREEVEGMVFVDPGTFTMGGGTSIQHQVTLTKGFYIGKYQMTRKLWADVVNATAASGHGLDPDPATIKEYPAGTANDSLPVINVSWDEVQKFIEALNSLPENVEARRTYRLPTEAEWEFAARGGNKTHGYYFSGSNGVNARGEPVVGAAGTPTDVAWFMSNSEGTSHPVGTLAPNELGTYDMSGNVREFCSDLYNAYTADPQIDPPGPATDEMGNLTRRVVRGGPWNNTAASLYVYARTFMNATIKTSNITGFRLVMTIAPPAADAAPQSIGSAQPEGFIEGVWNSLASGVKSLWNSITK